VETLEQVALPAAEQRGVFRRVDVCQFHKPERRGALTHEGVFEFVPAPFLSFQAAGIAAQVGAGEVGDEEARVAQRPMAADLPVVKILDVFLVVKYLQITVEASTEIRFQFQVQPGDQRSHCFATGIVDLMGVGDEQVVGHDALTVRFVSTIRRT